MRLAWTGLVLAAASALAADSPSDSSAALRALLEHVEANPGDHAARVRLGDAYLAMHDVQAAERSYLAVLEKEPAHAGALFGRGAAAQRRGWWDDAARFYQRALDADPRREPAAAAAALVHARSRAGDAAGGAKAVDRGVALRPNSRIRSSTAARSKRAPTVTT
jgi:tetratricopeptide (TPR) repeat protein